MPLRSDWFPRYTVRGGARVNDRITARLKRRRNVSALLNRQRPTRAADGAAVVVPEPWICCCAQCALRDFWPRDHAALTRLRLCLRLCRRPQRTRGLHTTNATTVPTPVCAARQRRGPHDLQRWRHRWRRLSKKRSALCCACRAKYFFPHHVPLTRRILSAHPRDRFSFQCLCEAGSKNLYATPWRG